MRKVVEGAARRYRCCRVEFSPHQHPGNLLNADELGQRIDLVKRLMEKVGEEFKFGTVVSFVLNKLLSFGCPPFLSATCTRTKMRFKKVSALCYTVAKLACWCSRRASGRPWWMRRANRNADVEGTARAHSARHRRCNKTQSTDRCVAPCPESQAAMR